jgi:hypothetical protein
MQTLPVSAPPRRSWLRVFGVGLLLWFATAVVTLLTGNANLLSLGFLALVAVLGLVTLWLTWVRARAQDQATRPGYRYG